MRVAGIDPGVKITGYAVVEGGGSRFALVEAGFVSTKERDPMARRVQCIYEDLLALFAETKPEAVVIEQLYSHYAHPRTAILMGHARGVVLLAAAKCGVPVTSYSATRIKRSLTGNGHAAKSQVQGMVQVMLGLHAVPEPPDVADAIAVALCHLNAAGKPDGLAGRKR